MRYSKQRELILNYINHTKDHPTAEMIYNEVQIAIPNVSLGTIYRNLTYLVEEHLVRKIITENECDRYDNVMKDHYHVYCTSCKELYDLESAEMDQINHMVEQESGYEITSHNIVFNGICPKCQN